MHIIHTVSSTEVLSSGITHCVNELSLGLSRLGERVEIISLGSDHYTNNLKKFELKFKNDLGNIPFLQKAGFSSAMKKYILASKSDILHTHGLWMFPNFYRNSHSIFVISPHGMLSKEALKFSSRKKEVFDFFSKDQLFLMQNYYLRQQRVSLKISENMV